MKKAIRKKVNPEKSNKMIYAVGGGLIAIIILLAIIFVDLGNPDKTMIFNDYVESLKKSRGIMEVKTAPESDKIELLYDSLINPRFKKEVFYILQSMSRKLKETLFEIKIYQNSWDTPETGYLLKNGKKARR